MAESAGDKDSRWYFTAEQLQNSPSRKCGIDADKELVYRQQTAYLIQEMGQALRVSQLCINTAIVYMHRFYAFHSFSHFNRHRIAAASLFLAAKVEEQPRKLEHVIRVAFTCLNIEAPDPSKETFAEQAQDLVFNENVLLQTLGFDVAIDHPHTHVVKTCHLVKACKDLAQTSYFMASNSLHLTTMCLQYKPTVVACFCIHLACRWSSWDIPHSSEGLPWFHYVDKSVTKELLTQLTEEFIQIYDKSPSRLKNKLNSIKTLAQSAKTDEGQRSGSSQERSNHHRASTSMSHHGKQQVDPKGVASSSSRQQHYQQMHHQSKSRERPVAPPPKTATQGSSGGGHRTLPPPRDAFASKSRPGFPPHHPSAGFPHKQPDYRQKEVSSSGSSSSAQAKGGGGQYQQSSGYFGEPTRSHSASQGMRYSQNSSHNKHGDPTFSHTKNSLHGVDESMGGNSEGGGGDGVSSPRLPQKSIFSPDQPDKVEAVVKKAPPPAPRFDERRGGEVKKDKRAGGEMVKTVAPEKKVASVKPMTKQHPQLFGQPYKASSASAQGKRSFDEMTRHEESGIDFREAKMRRSEAENESRARGKMESTMNPLNLGGSFNAFDATFDQPKSHKFPPSLVNSIETNADLVSCLLKESLSENKYGSALNAGGITEKQQQQQQQSEQPPAPAEPQIPPQGVTLAQPVKVEGTGGGAEGESLHHKSKSEKKKKKEKHKHKEKDKSKDREERKKHKRDKTREGGTDEIPKNPVTLKITLPPREKAATDGGAAAPDGGFKIKIPKDRIRADLNPGHGAYEAPPPGSLPSVDLMSEKPSSSLKIKISKDKIENFSDGASFGGAFTGGKKKDKDKEKLMRTTFQ